MNTDFKTYCHSKVTSNFKAIIVLFLNKQEQNDNELTVPNNAFLQEKVVICIGHSVH